MTVDQIIAGHRQLIRRAHAFGLKIYGGTLTPFGGFALSAPLKEQMRQAVLQVPSPERLGAGALGPTRVAVYKRHPQEGAADEIRTLLAGFEGTSQLRAVGVAGIMGAHLPAITGQDLIRLAELALEQALEAGGGIQRLVLQHEVSGARDVLTPA